MSIQGRYSEVLYICYECEACSKMGQPQPLFVATKKITEKLYTSAGFELRLSG